MDGEGGRRISTDEALSYLHKIKTAFRENKEKYECFVQIMRDSVNNRIGINDVISDAAELFKGNDDLLLGLNNFLPRGYEIKLPLIIKDTSETIVGIEVPTDFKSMVKTRFEENSHIYDSFLDIMKKLEEGEKSTKEAHEEIATLFEGHEDLLQELVRFLPGASGSAST